MEFWENLRMRLENSGFRKVRNKENWYWRAENPVLYLLCLLDREEEGWKEDHMTFADFGRRMEERLAEFHCTRVVALSVLVDKTEENDPVDIAETGDISGFNAYDEKFYRVFWQFSTESGKVTAGKHQPDKLLGIEKLLSAAAKGKEPEVLVLRDSKEQKKPIATAIIFAVCAALLLVTMLSPQGEEILAQFGLSPWGIQAGQYYRFFTSMFLHAGILHLVSNGVYLYYFGVRAERLLGTGRFLVLYLVSGLCGGLLSVALSSGGISIGASGAIYGLLGAMLLLTKKHGSRYTGMNYATMLLLAATAICFGFLEPGVDNMAHIGGLLGGMAVFALLLRKR